MTAQFEGEAPVFGITAAAVRTASNGFVLFRRGGERNKVTQISECSGSLHGLNVTSNCRRLL
jgi:hypothetical protein